MSDAGQGDVAPDLREQRLPLSLMGAPMMRRLWSLITGEGSVLIVTTAATNVVRLVSTMILTRLLAPDVFGAMGIISSIFFVIGMLTDLGFLSFVVRHPRGLERSFLDVIWTVHLLRGFALAAGAALLSVPLATYFLEKPVLALPMAVASLQFAINGLASLSLLTAVRNGGVRKLCWFDLGTFAVQVVVCILAAVVIKSVWAIIIGMLVQAALRSLLSYLLFPDAGQRIRFETPVLTEFWGFSRVMLQSGILTLLLAQSDKLVLARVFPIELFGLYSIASNLAQAPFSFAIAYASRLLYPRYAAAWRDAPETLPQVYYAARRKISLLYGFGAGGLAGGAPAIIGILYDPRYSEAAVYLLLLSVSPILVLTTNAASEFLLAIGNTRATLHANFTRVLWVFVMGSIGYALVGPIGIAAAAGSLEVAPLLFCWPLLRRAGVLNLRQEFLFFGASAVGGAVGLGVTMAYRMLA